MAVDLPRNLPPLPGLRTGNAQKRTGGVFIAIPIKVNFDVVSKSEDGDLSCITIVKNLGLLFTSITILGIKLASDINNLSKFTQSNEWSDFRVVPYIKGLTFSKKIWFSHLGKARPDSTQYIGQLEYSRGSKWVSSKPFVAQVVLREEKTQEEFQDKTKAITKTYLNQNGASDMGGHAEAAKAPDVGRPPIAKSFRENMGGTPYWTRIGDVDIAKEESNAIVTYQKQELLQFVEFEVLET